jgi:Tol biopolymer transport system component
MARLALLTTLALFALASPAAATFPGRNGPIAYYGSGSDATEDGGDSSSGLVVKRPRASQGRSLIECEMPGGVLDPAACEVWIFRSPTYSPDGSRIAFDSGERLAVIDADGASLEVLSAATTDDSDPAFTPNGRAIVFTGRDEHGARNVYIRSADGGPARLLVRNAREPVLSSRGRLAFVRDGVVYVADADGSDLHRVVTGWSPDWSPGGGRLVIVRVLRTRYVGLLAGGLFTVRPSGQGLSRLGNVKDAAHPVWSPDGRWIAYDRVDTGVHIRRVARHAKPHEVAPSEYGESGSVQSLNPGWRPLPR